MKITLFVFIFLLTLRNLLAQPITEKVLDKGDGSNIIETSPHHFLTLINDRSVKITVDKIDSSGTVLNSNRFGDTTGILPYNSAGDMIKISDNRFFITGSYETGTGSYDRGFVIMVDSSGDFVWDRTITYGNFTTSGWSATYDSISHVIYVLGGVIMSTPQTLLLKIDSSGTLIWQKNLGSAPVGKLFVASPDSILLLGTTSLPGYDGYLARYDSSGNGIWAKHYGGTSNDHFISLSMMPDSGFIILGNTTSFGSGNSDCWLLRTDRYGNTLWTKTYGYPTADVANGFTISNDSKIWICGMIRTNLSNSDEAWIIETDTSGNLLYTNQLGGIDDETLNSIIVSGNSIYSIGSSTSNLQNVYLVRIDSISQYTGVENSFDNTSISVFPNPSSDFINIHLSNSDINENMKITVYDFSGREVYANYTSEEDTKIMLPDSPGLYIIRMTNLKKTYFSKVIKS
jgi:hypothetical protein